MNYSNSQRAGVILYLTALLFGGYGVQAADKEKIVEEIIVEEDVNTEMQARNAENLEEIITVQKNTQPIVTSAFTDASENESDVAYMGSLALSRHLRDAEAISMNAMGINDKDTILKYEEATFMAAKSEE